MIRSLSAKILVVSLCLAIAAPIRADIITFEDLSLAPNSYENGEHLSPPGYFVSGGAKFNNDYSGFWSGWSYSNIVDTTTVGYDNQYAAYSPAGGDKSANYAMAFDFAPGASTIDFAPGVRGVSMRVTNATYAVLSMQTGDQFAKKFGGNSGDDPDFFLLTITGLDASNKTTGVINFYLADFRDSDNSKDYIVKNWTTIDLTPLGETASRLSFGMSSSDNSFGFMNTPSYFALDNLETAVPEPSSMALAAAGIGAAIAAHVRRRRRDVGRASSLPVDIMASE